jgi:very-short-patch-repair endonuclease
MKVLIVLAILIIVILLIVGKAARASKGNAIKSYEYFKKTPLTENEQTMYWRLIRALPDHVILTQVGLSRCVGTKTQPAFNTIAKKSVDFVVCNKASQIIAAIEIDDKSHSNKSRQKADETKDKALKAAGIEILRWPANPLPNEDEIRARFAALELVAIVNGSQKKMSEAHIPGQRVEPIL